MGEKRWELLQQRSDIVEMTFVWIVVFWILVIFLGFGTVCPAQSHRAHRLRGQRSRGNLFHPRAR
jgi:hypothetical protein